MRGQLLLGYHDVFGQNGGTCRAARWSTADSFICQTVVGRPSLVIPVEKMLAHDDFKQPELTWSVELEQEACGNEDHVWFRPGATSWCATRKSGWLLRRHRATPLDAGAMPPEAPTEQEAIPWPVERASTQSMVVGTGGRFALGEFAGIDDAGQPTRTFRLFSLEGDRPDVLRATLSLAARDRAMALAPDGASAAVCRPWPEGCGLVAGEGRNGWWHDHEEWEAADFSVDGRWLALRGTYSPLQILRVADGNPLLLRIDPLEHTSGVVWGPNGRIAVFSDEGRRLDLLRVDDGVIVRTGMVRLPTDCPISLDTDARNKAVAAFNSDGRWLLLRDPCEVVRVIPTGRQELIEEACRRLPLDLSEADKKALEIPPLVKACRQFP